MIDEHAVREQIRRIQDALHKNEAERDALLTMLRGAEAYLRARVNGQTDLPVPQVPLLEAVPQSLRGAILKVLRDARGEPLHVSEIWKRAQALGATSNASRPMSAVDLALYGAQNRQPIERAGPGKWRWKG
jgi:hypothetical protein